MSQTKHKRKVASLDYNQDDNITFDEVERLIKNHGLKEKDFIKINTIFKELDKLGTGSVKRTSFFGFISKNKDLVKTSIKKEVDFFYQSAGEKIILKLKNLKLFCLSQNNEDAIEDINWIIETLTNKDINDYDVNELGADAVYTLKQYSKAEDTAQRVSDLKKVTQGYQTSSKKTLTNSSMNKSKQDSLNKINNDTDKKSNLRNSLFSSIKVRPSKEDYNDNYNYNNHVENSINTLDIKNIHLLNESLSKYEDFDFDIFELDQIAGKSSLLYLSREIFDSLYFFVDLIPEMKFRNLISEITKGYSRESKYHNDLHAADVLQTVYILMEKGNIYYNCELTELDYLSILLSAIIHDYKHPGYNNSYLINSIHSIAICFNGKNILLYDIK